MFAQVSPLERESESLHRLEMIYVWYAPLRPKIISNAVQRFKNLAKIVVEAAVFLIQQQRKQQQGKLRGHFKQLRRPQSRLRPRPLRLRGRLLRPSATFRHAPAAGRTAGATLEGGLRQATRPARA